MDEQLVAFDDDQRPAGEPVQELVAVGRFEDRRDRVLPVRLRVSRGHGQQMQIVIAENGDGRGAERLHVAQHGERIRAAVDEIADEPQAVARLGKADELEQLAELRVAALDVADRVVAHGGAEARGGRDDASAGRRRCRC